MTEHGIIAREPVMQKSRWEYENGQAVQRWSKDKEHPDLSDELFSYQCDCGADFDTWNKAIEHLNEQN